MNLAEYFYIANRPNNCLPRQSLKIREPTEDNHQLKIRVNGSKTQPKLVEQCSGLKTNGLNVRSKYIRTINGAK